MLFHYKDYNTIVKVTIMNYIKEVRQGVDAGHGTSCNLYPANGEGRVGNMD